MHALAPLLFAAAAAAPGWARVADDADVRGLRPAVEVRAALSAASDRLAGCAGGGGLLVDVAILAAGFVDRVVVIDAHGGDEACAIAALRGLRFKDRGREPPTHAVVRV